ncbi:hypothetical protein AMTR_s00026p00148450 [Amborella trichopoda]|uniref:Uncharacterized protein n=1 Tax=Amborella trichopoda TaxID=13333 RepID=W1PQR3_AMBTC|nr:hypothetical protein AMTR_s00026p00148450 [Amborella trichopoda]
MNGLDSLMGFVVSNMAARDAALPEMNDLDSLMGLVASAMAAREKVWAGDPAAVQTARGLSRHGDDTCSG